MMPYLSFSSSDVSSPAMIMIVFFDKNYVKVIDFFFSELAC